MRTLKNWNKSILLDIILYTLYVFYDMIISEYAYYITYFELSIEININIVKICQVSMVKSKFFGNYTTLIF